MYLLYSLLLTLGALALLPLLLFRGDKYRPGLRQRLGRWPHFDAAGRPVLWLHCVSVGETQAARPLVQALSEAYPNYALIVSTITVTGQRLAQEIFSELAAAVFYFPFDWAWTVRRAVRHFQPSAVLILETELWPNFLRVCRAENVPVILVNGRLSAASVRGYQRVGWFISRVVNDLTLALMQSETDAERLATLGLPAERSKVSGNIKFDLQPAPDEPALTEALRARFAFGHDTGPLLVAASTHAPEERILLEALQILRQTDTAARLLIAPRHPPRFAETASLIARTGLRYTRRADPSQASDAQADVVLLDTIGELRAVYPLATIVFMGGSIAPTGGHNVLEPAVAGACIVTGPHTFNFAAIVKDFLAADALLQLREVPSAETAAQLAQTWRELLDNEPRRRQLGDNARRTLAENRGATARTIAYLNEVESLKVKSRKS